MHKMICRFCRVAVVALLCGGLPLPAADWPTFGHDPQRSGWAPEEDTLTAQNVARLQLLWKAPLKNEPKSLTALTAPLVASGVSTVGGVKSVVYTAGSDNHLFAVDGATGKLIWTHEFETYVLPKNPGMWLCPNGLNATPTIDRRTDTIYTIAMDGRLYGLDLGTGRTKFGPVQFVPAFSKNWSLNFVDGFVYTALSQGCGGAESGLSALDVGDPMHAVVRSFFVSMRGGGIWGRGGPVVGENGKVYGATGDGEFDPGRGEFSNAVVAASLGDLKLLDYFVPNNYRDVSKYDLDMGAGSPVWLSYKGHNLLVFGGKEGTLYLMNADLLGDKDHYSPLQAPIRLGNDQRVFQGQGTWGASSAWRDVEGEVWVYVPVWGPLSKDAPRFPVVNGTSAQGSVVAFRVTSDGGTGKTLLEPAWITGEFNLPEPVAIANGVVFAISTGENAKQVPKGNGVITDYAPSELRLLTDAERGKETQHATLVALDAKTGKELYNSGDAFSTWVHFSGLAIADGRVYAVDHDSNLYCFGLKGK